MRDHVIVTGFGSTGRSAVEALLAAGMSREAVVVVDVDPAAVRAAVAAGHTGVAGDASMTTVLDEAGIASAATVVVTPNRDDTAVLVTLTAREQRPDVQIVAAGRERENLHLLRQSGADAVIDSSAAVGRLLTLATRAPRALAVVDDLLDSGTSLELAQVAPVTDPDGGLVPPPATTVLEVVRGGTRTPWGDGFPLAAGDELVVVQAVR